MIQKMLKLNPGLGGYDGMECVMLLGALLYVHVIIYHVKSIGSMTYPLITPKTMSVYPLYNHTLFKHPKDLNGYERNTTESRMNVYVERLRVC